MNRNEMLQRFYKVPGKVAYQGDELVCNHASARLVFRETEKRVRDRRVSNSQWVVTIGLGQLFLLLVLTFVPILYFFCLFTPFAAIGFWGIRKVAKQRVFEDQQAVYFEIDVDRQKIIYRPVGEMNYKEIDIDQILNFSVRIENNRNGIRHSLGCSYRQHDEIVYLRRSSLSKNKEQIFYYARLLGFLCDKAIFERKPFGKMIPIKTSDIFETLQKS